MGLAPSIPSERARGAVRSSLVELTVSVFDNIGKETAFPLEPVFSILGPRLGARGVVLQRIDWTSGASTLTLHGCPQAWVPLMLDATRTLRHTHPLLVALAAGDLAPATAEQTAGGHRTWRSSESRSFLGSLMEEPQLASVGLRGGGTDLLGIAFARSGRDFSPDDLALLAEVQPVLQALDRHLTRLQRWRSSWGPAAGRAAASVAATGLTRRQVEVLLLLADGLTATAVARRLRCSPRTVHNHTANLFHKLGVHDRLGAVLEAQRRGLLPPAPTR